jgi:hypothetical protein
MDDNNKKKLISKLLAILKKEGYKTEKTEDPFTEKISIDLVKGNKAFSLVNGVIWDTLFPKGKPEGEEKEEKEKEREGDEMAFISHRENLGEKIEKLQQKYKNIDYYDLANAEGEYFYLDSSDQYNIPEGERIHIFKYYSTFTDPDRGYQGKEEENKAMLRALLREYGYKKTQMILRFREKIEFKTGSFDKDAGMKEDLNFLFINNIGEEKRKTLFISEVESESSIVDILEKCDTQEIQNAIDYILNNYGEELIKRIEKAGIESDVIAFSREDFERATKGALKLE